MATVTALDRLRAQARRSTLFAPVTLAQAVERLGFVQADPIRAPARAQDLILRHRVRGYRAGDLERGFRRLKLEEDYLYAYGFMPPDTRSLLHPRLDPGGEGGGYVPDELAAEVLAFVRSRRRPCHPRDLELRFGRERAVNGWGGFSKATTRALEELRHHGLLRVAQRRDGIRTYEAAPDMASDAVDALDPADRARRLALLVARVLGPISVVSLRATLAHTARHCPGLPTFPRIVAELLASGELARADADGESYVWPAGDAGVTDAVADPRDVRLLAPFDPLVWDRRRFEHFWGWAYRFEAYTPVSRRIRGYYAMPLLWGDAVIGWGNVTVAAGGIQVSFGFAGQRPRGPSFQRAVDRELARMEQFIAPRRAARATLDAAPGEAD